MIPGTFLNFDTVYSRVDVSYYDKASAVYDELKSVIQESSFKAVIYPYFRNDMRLKAYQLVDPQWTKLYPNLKVFFVSQIALDKKTNAQGMLIFDITPKVLWTFRIPIRNECHLILSVPATREQKLSRSLVIAAVRNDKSKSVFVHEFSHYLQRKKLVYFESPFKDYEKDYHTMRTEREAFLSQLIHGYDYSVISEHKEYLNNYDKFKSELFSYIKTLLNHSDEYEISHGINYTRIFNKLSAKEIRDFIKDTYTILRKKYGVKGS